MPDRTSRNSSPLQASQWNLLWPAHVPWSLTLFVSHDLLSLAWIIGGKRNQTWLFWNWQVLRWESGFTRRWQHKHILLQHDTYAARWGQQIPSKVCTARCAAQRQALFCSAKLGVCVRALFLVLTWTYRKHNMVRQKGWQVFCYHMLYPSLESGAMLLKIMQVCLHYSPPFNYFICTSCSSPRNTSADMVLKSLLMLSSRWGGDSCLIVLWSLHSTNLRCGAAILMWAARHPQQRGQTHRSYFH